jgi:SAM-dependent methyltransferase
MVKFDVILKNVLACLRNNFVSNEAFVDICYELFLERKSDLSGKQEACKSLKKGQPRLEFIKSIVTSNEYFNVLTHRLFGKVVLPDLRQIRPDNYFLSSSCDGLGRSLVFRAKEPSDYVWLERMITEHGYYEKPGVWSLTIDTDKHVISEIIGKFNPHCCLEIGCSTGAILKLLKDNGIYSEGVEISHLALALSYPEIRRRIHFGDVLTLDLKPKFDMIIGMDIFEHLNPNKLPIYLKCCNALLRKNSFLFANVPAFGKDPVFGEVFPIYLKDWSTDSETPFSFLEVDEKGWPLNGHLIWATAPWWQKMFEFAGFKREVDIEFALHEIFDDYMFEHARARRSFFIFSKDLESPFLADEIINKILEKH